MNPGFPIHFISRLGCTNDGGALELKQNYEPDKEDDAIRQGTLRCRRCTTDFPIDDGILNMLDDAALTDESKHEKRLRNLYATRRIKAGAPTWWEDEHNLMEMIPTLEAMSIRREHTILELGCGDGRYTTSLAGRCRWLLAVDFSIDSLRILQQRLSNVRNVGIILGDITTLKITPSFDRVLSTLVSNLPSDKNRKAMYHMVANALKHDGRFVFSTHNQGIRQRLARVPRSGRYNQGGIYRHNFTVRECVAEVQPYFESVKARPIQIYIPLARTMRLPLVASSRFFERVPFINNLGALILCTAERGIFSEHSGAEN